MPIADAAPAAPGVPVPENLPPGAVPLLPGQAAQDGAPYPVEQRVTSTELKSRDLDQPEDGPPVRLLEALPREMVEGLPLPLSYVLATSQPPRAALRLADSAPARAKGYTCVPFYKPISRSVGGRG
jgi:hypothetical protein